MPVHVYFNKPAIIIIIIIIIIDYNKFMSLIQIINKHFNTLCKQRVHPYLWRARGTL